ncbi:MAG: pyruvate dehydrogenase (acetyl-transferring) E1 component subunit alpha [Spirochaetes bacterium]|nr:pyruvate dehydrogenase (acetyl-transferring) E1 component subunit alpha [Spirochaetota bacterium]
MIQELKLPKIPYIQVMDNQGKVIHSENLPKLSKDQLLNGYRLMLLARELDLKCVSYQRQGRLYTLPPNLGQEASAVGSGFALSKDDWLVSAYRELGAYLSKGLSIKTYLKYWLGNEEGAMFPKELNMLPYSVPIASQLAHGAGLGFAMKYQAKKSAIIAYVGDGGTSEGDFHESLNFAAVFELPVVFFCTNNQYAISYPRALQTRSKTIAQKALAYGMPGLQVDGNDFLAVYQVTQSALDHAKSGKGPVLIESLTYRLGAHTTSDDPSLYRNEEEENQWKEKDPIKRMKFYLMDQNLWSEKEDKDLITQYQTEIDQTFSEVEKNKDIQIEDIFKYEFEQIPDELTSQLMELKNYLARKGE